MIQNSTVHKQDFKGGVPDSHIVFEPDRIKAKLIETAYKSDRMFVCVYLEAKGKIQTT